QHADEAQLKRPLRFGLGLLRRVAKHLVDGGRHAGNGPGRIRHGHDHAGPAAARLWQALFEVLAVEVHNRVVLSLEDGANGPFEAARINVALQSDLLAEPETDLVGQSASHSRRSTLALESLALVGRDFQFGADRENLVGIYAEAGEVVLRPAIHVNAPVPRRP